MTVIRKGRLRLREGGQGLVEYALILVLVAVAAIVILAVLGRQIQNVFCEPCSRWEITPRRSRRVKRRA